MLVLELVPEELAKLITQKLTIPTIGIAAGRYTDGQVLIVTDMLGYMSKKFRHSKSYMNYRSEALDAIKFYADDVLGNKFPDENHVRHMNDEEFLKLQEWLELN